MASGDAGVTFIQCNKPNQIGLLARRQIRSQVMRTSWRKRKKTTTSSLPTTNHKNAQPFNPWENVNTMAIPDFLLGMYFIRGFNQSPAVADSPTESVCGGFDPHMDIVAHRQLLESMINPDTKIDIEIMKGTQNDDTADPRWCHSFVHPSLDGVDPFMSGIAPMDLRMHSYLQYCESLRKDFSVHSSVSVNQLTNINLQTSKP
jgi:hypothetical protein